MRECQDLFPQVGQQLFLPVRPPLQPEQILRAPRNPPPFGKPANLERSGEPPPMADLQVASIVIANSLVLITGNI
jgi:hypothetical protein